MEKTIDILIITRSIALQQGLGALLESLPGIGNVKASLDLSKAYHRIESHRPRIILLDIALAGNDPRLALQQIKQCSPGTQRVLLVDDVQAVKWLSHDAEAILIRGGSAANVASIVADLLSSEAENNERDHPND